MGDPAKIQISLIKSIGLLVSWGSFGVYKYINLFFPFICITFNYGKTCGLFEFHNELF